MVLVAELFNGGRSEGASGWVVNEERSQSASGWVVQWREV